jgi:hypothetical protein
MFFGPLFIVLIGFYSSVQIVIALFEVEQWARHTKADSYSLGNFAGNHEAAYLGLAQLFLFAINGPGTQAYTTFVKLSRYDDRSTTLEEMIGKNIVGLSQSVQGHTIS